MNPTVVCSHSDEEKEHVKNQPVVHADETSHKNKGNKRWMWLATTALVAVFIIRGHRSAKDAKALLGETFQGILVSDRWSAYTWVNISFRQFCWAHLIRDFIKISERSGQAGRIGDQLLDSGFIYGGGFVMARSKGSTSYWR